MSITVVERVGRCANGHRIGQEWVLEGKTPEGRCLSAFVAMAPYISTMRFGGSFPWQADTEVTRVGCPDPVNRTVFELRRFHE